MFILLRLVKYIKAEGKEKIILYGKCENTKNIVKDRDENKTNNLNSFLFVFKILSILNTSLLKKELKIKDEVGIINVGGEHKSVYEFVSQYQKVDTASGAKIAPSLQLNIEKLKGILNE